jgi:hypothetical protein
MSERLHSSSSVPDFSTYPEEPATAAPNLEATYATYRRYSGEESGEDNPLAKVAARLGNTFGNVVSQLRDAVWRVRNRVHSTGASDATGGYDLRTRARQMAKDEPLKVILAAGALGLFVGASIRVWRQHD